MLRICPNQPTLRTLCITGLVVLLAMLVFPLSAQGPGGEPAETYEKVLAKPYLAEFARLFPMQEGDGDLWIVPVSLLRADLAQQATGSITPAGQLEEFVAYSNQVAARLDRKRCDISPVAFGSQYSKATDPQSSDAWYLLDVISSRELVFLGTIEHITPSWDFDYRSVVSVVFVRIEEVLRDSSESFSEGDLVTYIRWWGEATILGIPFCTDPPAGVSTQAAPAVGEQIVLTGSKDLKNPGHLVNTPTEIYPVVDGAVYPPEGDNVPPGYSGKTATLAQIRESLQ